MSQISKFLADTYRNAYRNAIYQRKKNLESALFSITEVEELIRNLPQGTTHLKVFVVADGNGDINLCMTGGLDGVNTENPGVGKRERDATLDLGIQVLISDIPCPPHCGQVTGASPNGLDNKYVTT